MNAREVGLKTLSLDSYHDSHDDHKSLSFHSPPPTSFLEKLALFSREQQHTQRSSGAKNGQAADLVSYVEQQRNYRMAVKVHKESLEATATFWTSLTLPEVKLNTLTAAVAKFDIAVANASSVYRYV